MSVTRLKALLHITSAKLDEKEDDEFISSQMRFASSCVATDSKNVEEVQLALKCMINLCSTSTRNQLFFDSFNSNLDRTEFMRRLKYELTSSTEPDSEMSRLTMNLLCNLTRDTWWSSVAVEEDPHALLNFIFRTDESLNSTLPLLLNLTSQKEIRKRLSTLASLRTRLIDLLTRSPDQILLVTGILKNCFFDDEYHLMWLAPQSKLLEGLLKPLCGPEDQIDDEDRQKLPSALRLIAGRAEAIRTESHELKQTICEALLQLCATSDGRTRLRDCGTYFVLRELHKFENSKLSGDVADSTIDASERRRTNELIYQIEQVVDQLICREEERDPHSVERSLRTIDVDEETSTKLIRAKEEFISTS